MFTNARRVAGGLGVLGVILWAIAFGVGSGSPNTTDNNVKIVSWFSSSSHQNTQIAAFLLFVVGALCILVFLSGLREQLAAAEGGAGLAPLAFGAGVAAVVLILSAVALFTAPAFLIADAGMSVFVPNDFRTFNDAGYEFWVAASAVAALTVWSTSAVAFRTGVLPRWFAWFGVVVGIVQLLAVFFIPALIFWLWVVVASILMLRAPGVPPAREPILAAEPGMQP
ncbi:MAG TPA: hypothetical protein VFQ71_11125 [Gaiellales bacterium]|jgi:hypothetical protein|nr:hypothetical protein [Gaiellales bacterium]